MTLLCGPLGTMKGRTIPTTAQIAENSTTGRNEAPILRGAFLALKYTPLVNINYNK